MEKAALSRIWPGTKFLHSLSRMRAVSMRVGPGLSRVSRSNYLLSLRPQYLCSLGLLFTGLEKHPDHLNDWVSGGHSLRCRCGWSWSNSLTQRISACLNRSNHAIQCCHICCIRIDLCHCYCHCACERIC